MKTAIIFGVTGQDGSYLAELLLAKNYRVVGVSRRTSSPNDARIAHLTAQSSFEVVPGDVTDALSVHRILDHFRPAEVYNLAAQSHVKVSFDEPSHTTDVTYKGCLNILESIRHIESSVPAGTARMRFYQASSSEMFGSCFSWQEYNGGDGYHLHSTKLEPGFMPECFQDETTPFLPNSPYAIAKLAAHHLCRVYRESYGVYACSGILFNHESERRAENFVTRKITKYVGAFARWWTNVQANEPGGIELHMDLSPGMVSTVRVNRNKQPYGHQDSWACGPKFPKLKLGNLDACRDWGHAEDYVRGMWLMLQQVPPADYVLATGEVHSVQEFLEAAFAVVGLKSDGFVEIDSSLYRPCEVAYLRGDATKARTILNWKPEVSFTQLVERMVRADTARE